MEDNLQAAKVLEPLADEAVSASAEGIPCVCVRVYMSACVRLLCCHSSTFLSRLSHDTRVRALRTATVAWLFLRLEEKQSKMATHTF